MSGRDVPSDQLAKAELAALAQVIAAGRPAPRPSSVAHCKLRNVKRLLAVRTLCQDAMDDALAVIAPDRQKTYIEAFLSIQQWADATIDDIAGDVRAES